jgi:hypothetical protein
MNWANFLGYAFAASFAAMLGSILLYLIDLFRLGRMLRAGKIQGFHEQLKAKFPIESPIQPAFRALMRFMSSPNDLDLRAEDLRIFRECRRNLIVCAVIFMVTFSMAILISQIESA